MALNKTLEITVDLRDADKKLRAFSAQVKKRERINRMIAVQLRNIVMNNFKTESNSGIKWARLKAGGRWRTFSGAKGRKRSLDTSARILQDTGNLRNSFIELYTKDLTGVGARAAAGVNYAIVHEKGSQKKNIPARPMLPTAKQVSDTALRIYSYEVDRVARAEIRP